MNIGEGISGAVFSDDGVYRYSLWRFWDREKPALLFVGLNPSTANGIKDDPTIRRLAGFAKSWGLGGLYAGNLFSVITPYPEQLVYGDAVGPDNDQYLAEMKKLALVVMVGWGTHGGISSREKAVMDILGKSVYCLAVTKTGQPGHPLYLPSSSQLIPYIRKDTLQSWRL